MRSCFCGSGQAWRSLEVDQVDVPPALLSFIPIGTFRVWRALLAFHFTSLSHSTRRGATTHFSPEVHSLRQRVRVPVPPVLSTSSTNSLDTSQILTFSHARSVPCLVAFPPGHSVFSHSAEFPNKINAHLNASVERASFGSSIAVEARSCCWRA